jgi:hypothetical protein
MALYGLNITIQKSLCWAFSVPLSCRLIFHKIACVSLDVSILLTFCIHLCSYVFFPKLALFYVLSEYRDFFVIKEHVFCGFSKKITSVAVILDLRSLVSRFNCLRIGLVLICHKESYNTTVYHLIYCKCVYLIINKITRMNFIWMLTLFFFEICARLGFYVA